MINNNLRERRKQWDREEANEQRMLRVLRKERDALEQRAHDLLHRMGFEVPPVDITELADLIGKVESRGESRPLTKKTPRPT